ncbi:PhoPQ-activated protein PqaA family protein [Xenorhabdus sp. XENO-7]|uniref:PhoPQ-activated protein PqaA family protein n=1 Tax=Xenorhabdus aichiensis TaxID=3025874 RepID=A0ABT5M4K3_9GAMM|nr:PhoPQ-activated protein PqaA family protein [Xenorhabdus aichiensis]MDC9621880.1 PhoPQ-activated protein PqaA family protein [Xenorhabdus aichiensis]
MKLSKLFITLFFFSAEGSALINTENAICQEEDMVDFSHVIPCYRAKLAALPVKYSLQGKKSLPNIELLKYEMTSQRWSPGNLVSPDSWQHDVDMYIPDNPKSQHALVVVNNGTNYDDGSKKTSQPTNFSEKSLAEIARSTSTIVISVSNIPNQYITYENNKPLKEDDSVARSWALFMDGPEQRELIPLHIPMAVTVSQAMRVAKQELKEWNINKFIVTGASKRGWTAWLSSISDPDVDAIVPFVMDLLSTDLALENMYRTYGGNWPITFSPYYQQGIDKLIKTPNFLKLMKLEDPLRYLDSDYQSRLTIPKYIINASGDDFYAPDNSRFYYDKLPGEKSLRVAPNSDHYGIQGVVEQSLISFINRFQNKTALPKLMATVHENKTERTLTVNFSEKPVKVTRWTAINLAARDFRYVCGIRYTSSSLEISTGESVKIPLSYKAPGWEATYIEATFHDGYVATTQVYITPDEKYPVVAPPSNGIACQTLPGRGLGESKP